MRLLRVLGAFSLILASACLISGVYGALHDQITYTISPEYFTEFKFKQFGLVGSSLSNRLKCAVIGFLASWWVGLLIGSAVGIGTWRWKPFRSQMREAHLAFVLIFGITLTIGFGGFIYGCFIASHDRGAYPHWYFPESVLDEKAYLIVGHIHNAAYLGGALATVLCCFWLWLRHRRWQRSR
ncbi:MAG: hypothetical protein AAF236_08755 [Verrucomicrobiota bacterium]